MTLVFKSHQLQSNNNAYIELSRETLHHQLSVLFPLTGLISLIIAFSHFVSDSHVLFLELALGGAALSFLLSLCNKRHLNPYVLIWIFILFTSATCLFGFYNDATSLVSNTMALTIPLLCFFALKHQPAWWYSSLFGLVYIATSADELGQKHLQINEALQNISAYGMVLVMAYLLAQHRNEAIRRVKKIATSDFLTDLPNRKGIEAVYYQEAYRANRYLKDLSLVLVDIDGLKDINDRYGLVVGDQVLMMLSACLKDYARQGDHIARIGGAEFCLLLPETSLHDAETFALSLKKHVANCQLALDSGVNISVTVSIGLTAVEFQDFSLDYIKADSALERAKNWGRDQIAIG